VTRQRVSGVAVVHACWTGSVPSSRRSASRSSGAARGKVTLAGSRGAVRRSAPSEAAMSNARRRLCGVYLAIAVVALIATWRQNLAFMAERGAGLTDFWLALLVNRATISITVDLFLFALAAAVWMVLEARLGARCVDRRTRAEEAANRPLLRIVVSPVPVSSRRT
jgi:hypothetical protein